MADTVGSFDHGHPLRIMFQDEARFGRINDPRRCWAPAGCRPVVGRQVVRESTYAFAAISPLDGVLDSLILPETNAETMSLFLEEVSLRHCSEAIVMCLDGAGWHRARALEIPANIRLLLLPPYSPELNPVENFWKDMRLHWFENRVFPSMDAVEDRLEKGLVAYESKPETVQSITGYPWIISDIMNAT